MFDSFIKQSQVSQQFGLSTQHTINTQEIYPQNVEQFFNKSHIDLTPFEDQISQIQQAIKKEIGKQDEKSIEINEAHFWFKKNNNHGQRKIVIQSEYLQDNVFDNLLKQQQEQLDNMFVQAKAQIDRLTQILISRDEQIMYLRNQIQGCERKQQGVNTDFDIQAYLKEYDKLKHDNRNFQAKIKQLTNEIKNNAKRQEQQNRRRSISTTNVVRITSNKPVIKQNNSLSSSVVSHLVKQKRSIQIQTDNEIIKNEQVDNLKNKIITLNRQFQSLKNDNFLFVEDLQSRNSRISQLEKIIQVQNSHIKQLTEQNKQQQTQINRIINALPQISISNSKINDHSLKIQQLNQMINTLQQQKNILSIKLSQFNAQFEIISNNNNEMQSLLNKIQNQNRVLITKKTQLELEIQTILSTNKSNEHSLKSKNQQLSDKIVALEKDIMDMFKRQQQITAQKQDLVNKIIEQEVQWNDIRNQLQKQIQAKQSRIGMNNKLKYNDPEYEVNQKTIDILRNEVQEKNTIIQDLERRQKQLNKIISINKNQSKSKSVAGFGTNISLNDRIPNKQLSQIQTSDELIEIARQLVHSKSKDIQKMYSVLDLLTEQFELLRQQYFNSSHGKEKSQSSIYEHQTNNYIETLLQKIADYEFEEQRLYSQNNKLKAHIDRMSLLYSGQDNYKDEDELLNQLQFQRKLTQKLSNHIKSLKQQVYHLTAEVEQKNQQLFQMISQGNRSKKGFKPIDRHFGSIHNDRNYSSRNQSYDVTELMEQIQVYRVQLQRAQKQIQYLKQCIVNYKNCQQCLEYQVIVQKLQQKINRYQQMIIGQTNNVFVNSQKQTEMNKNQRRRIQSLKQQTNIRPSEKGFENHKKSDFPIIKNYTHLISKNKQNINLNILIQDQKLTLETILIIMQKILIQADNQRLYMQKNAILPEHIQIVNYNSSDPKTIVIKIVQSFQSHSQSSNLFLAPQRLRNCEPTRKSLVWNIGIIFHLLINKKLFFSSQSQILRVQYRYDNKILPQLRPILQNMLQKDALKRKLFSQIEAIVNNQISKLNILKSRF